MKAHPESQVPIVVLGATGTIGKAVVAQLLERGLHVRAAVRDPGKAAGLWTSVDVVQAELERPETLSAPFAGAAKAFIVSNGPSIALHANAFAAAKAAGTRHIVRVSAQELAFPELAVTPLGQWHLESERSLRESGLSWTLLRPSFFSSNVLVPFLFDHREGTALPSGGGKEAPIDPRDIAAAGVRALTSPGHEGKTYVLTGPQLLGYAEMTAKLAGAIGRPLRHVESSEIETRDRLLATGLPVPFADSLLGHFAAVRAGRSTLTSTVADLLGRPPRSFDEWIEDHRADLLALSQAQP